MKEEIKKQLKEKIEDFTSFLEDNEIPSLIMVDLDEDYSSVSVSCIEDLCDVWIKTSMADGEEYRQIAEILKAIQFGAVANIVAKDKKRLLSLMDLIDDFKVRDIKKQLIKEALFMNTGKEVN